MNLFTISHIEEGVKPFLASGKGVQVGTRGERDLSLNLL